MDVVGSEIGQKMRSAIKAKLTELGCYVDDELPDYVMVMVANKRTRTQMEDDLQLFLSDNTNLFVNWLHQVLKKLQEVTIAAPIKTVEPTQTKERSKSKERKSKEKKLKHKEKSKKSEHAKKAKKKEKEKSQRKKDEKTLKSKKKSKVEKEGHIRPNIPPLLMNMEKESEPSITDAFAGQILKNHGITAVEMSKIEPITENEPVVIDKRPILPIIDPDTILTQSEPTSSVTETTTDDISNNDKKEIQELIDIETKIVGFKQKINETSDVMSDDEDFLNIRTEAEELMNDFVEDQEISQPISTVSSPPNNSTSPVVTACTKEDSKETEETLLQIELQLPKRPIRERIGLKEEPKKFAEDEKVSQRTTSPERFTPEREPEPKKPAKARLGEMPQRKRSISDSSDKSDTVLKKERLTSKVSALGSGRACASVVRVRPRPRGPMPNSSLLMRAVADAHKSLLHAPQISEPESRKVKRALVHPMRRSDDVNIVIQVPMEHSELSCDKRTDEGTEREYAPLSMNKRFHNSDYVPSVRRDSRSATKRDDTIIVETINIHNQTVDKEQKTQFIVTMDGYHPNAFLAKKLMTEGLLDDDGNVLDQPKNKDIGPPLPEEVKNEAVPVTEKQTEKTKSLFDKQTEKTEQKSPSNAIKKRLSDTSEESDTQVIVKPESVKRNSVDISENKNKEIRTVKKRKASPIVFDVKKENDKDQNKSRERTESASSDNHVTITTTVNSHKYDAVPSLSQAERAPVSTPCRSFPLCRFGASCAFQHPRCKFAASCTRRGCVYDHSKTVAGTPPSVASHVVPAANYKSISTVSVAPQMCKFYPNCVNPTCHYFHPKPCRYGAACVNKLVCNFYHPNVLY